MITRVVSKPNLQAMLTALRAAKLTVTKSSSGFYRAVTFSGHSVLEAAPGRNDYLVRLEADLFGKSDWDELA